MKVLSFGEIIWDTFPTDKALGGAPLNFAAHAALQGAEALLVSAVGDDSYGDEAIKKIRSLGLSTDFISVCKDAPTGSCDIVLDENGVPSYNILEGVAYDMISVAGLPSECDAIAFGTLALRAENNRRTLGRILDEVKFAEIYTDLNIRPPFYSAESVELCLSRASIVKISDEELPIVCNLLFGNSPDAHVAPYMIAERYPAINLIIITKGADGTECYDTKKQSFCSVSAVPTEIVSTVGAGDSFGATFLTQYLKTHDAVASMTLAAKVSAFVVAHKGAIPDDMVEFLHKSV